MKSVSESFARVWLVCAWVVPSLTVAAAPAGAQSCLGMSGRSVKSLSVAGSVIKFPRAMDYRARFGFVDRRVFGGLRIGAVEFPDRDRNSFAMGADVGVPINFGSTRAWTLCPVVEASYESGMDIVSDIKVTYRPISVAPGMSLGRDFEVNDRVSLLTFAGASWVKSRTEVKAWYTTSRFTRSDWFVHGGVAAQLDRKFVLRLHAQNPVGVAGARPAFGASVGYLFQFKWNREQTGAPRRSTASPALLPPKWSSR